MHNLTLIIDDDPISILVCETVLKKASFSAEIKSFNSGEHGLNFLKELYNEKKITPDFIFLDLIMPELNGLDVLKAYEELLPPEKRIPHVVMLSAAFDQKDREESEKSPLLIRFVSKPMTLEILKEIDAR